MDGSDRCQAISTIRSWDSTPFQTWDVFSQRSRYLSCFFPPLHYFTNVNLLLGRSQSRLPFIGPIKAFLSLRLTARRYSDAARFATARRSQGGLTRRLQLMKEDANEDQTAIVRRAVRDTVSSLGVLSPSR